MLDQARDSHFGTAWMRDSLGARSLRVRQWANAPSAQGTSFYAPDFALKQTSPWLLGDTFGWAPVAEPLPAVVGRVEPSSSVFARLHGEIMELIARGEFSKVVPIVCEELEFSAPLRAEMFTSLWNREFSHQYTYGFNFQNEGLCGVTPELLFSLRGDQLRTMALAGTGRVDGPSLLTDRKECLEHQLVVDHLVSELKSWGQPEVGRTEEREFGVLKHLRTPIQMRLQREVSFAELVACLHPTAALGGWPRKPAVAWLEKQDFHLARSRFGAPFGFSCEEEMRCVVAIRGLQWKGKKALLAAGCGVVHESQSPVEWNELALKRRATRLFLGLEP